MVFPVCIFVYCSTLNNIFYNYSTSGHPTKPATSVTSTEEAAGGGGCVTNEQEAASLANLPNGGHVTGKPARHQFESSADLPGGRTVSSADLPNRPAGHRSSRDLPAPVITSRQLPLPEWSREYSTPSRLPTLPWAGNCFFTASGVASPGPLCGVPSSWARV